MLKILNDKSIKYRRFSSIMIGILDKKFLFAIIILTSCNQKIESNTETSVDENQLDIIEYEIPVTFEEDFETCLLYTSPSPRDPKTSRMPSSA